MILMQEILDMSVTERIQMMEKIWDSIDRTQIETPSTHEQELDKRLARYEKGETSFTSWEAIRSELHRAK
jgi:putative addiction module component (TIGR02574 family)